MHEPWRPCSIGAQCWCSLRGLAGAGDDRAARSACVHVNVNSHAQATAGPYSTGRPSTQNVDSSGIGIAFLSVQPRAAAVLPAAVLHSAAACVTALTRPSLFAIYLTGS